MINLLFVVGSTGGHLYPALSILPHCQRVSLNCTILGPKSIQNKLKIEEDKLFLLSDLYLKKLDFPIKLINNIRQTLEIIRDKDVVVSFGSIFSVPPSLVGKLKKKRLIITEQNVLPGRATRILSYFADTTIIPFEESINFLPKKTKKIIMLPPIREELINIEKGEENTLLLFGGSLGSRTINNIGIHLIKNAGLLDKKIKKIVLITGKNLFDEVVHKIKEQFNKDIQSEDKISLDFKNVEVMILKYTTNMACLYKDSFIVISRAGGSTLSELLYLKKRAIVIPYPYALDNHQLINAKVVKKYSNFIDYIEEPIDFGKVLEKIEKLIQMEPEYLNEVSFFNFEVFFEKIMELTGKRDFL